jgi:chromosomal replication initiator protein
VEHPAYTFATFVSSEDNADAVAAAVNVARGACNALLLHGETGCGKTHLLHATAHEIRVARPEAKVVRLAAADFILKLTKAIHFDEMDGFRRSLATIDAFLLDDAEFDLRLERTYQVVTLHLEAILDRGAQVVVTSTRAPAAIPRIAARFRTAKLTDVHSPIRAAHARARIRQLLPRI